MENDGEMVRVESIKGGLALVNPLDTALSGWGFGNVVKDYWTSVDESTEKGKQLVFRCLMEKGDKLRKMLNMPIEATDILIGPVEFMDRKTGEMTRTLLTRFITPDGAILSTHSFTVAAAVAHFSKKLRPPPWNPPIRFKIEEREGSEAGGYYVFVPEMAQTARPANNPKAK